MKVWLGFGRTLYVFDPALMDDMLLRVWEHDPNAIEGALVYGKPTITLSDGLSVDTRRQINNEVYTVNGIRRPTAEEIEADAMRTKPSTASAPAPCRAIVVYRPPVAVPPPLVTPPVICLPAPLTVSLWHAAMAA